MDAGIEEVRAAPADDGRVELIVRRPEVDVREVVEEAQLDPDKGLVGDNVKFTTVYMPLLRTPMIEPTDIYKSFPTLTPEEAAQMLCDAMIDKPKKMASRLGTFGELLYTLSPKSVDIVLNTAYNLFPDSKAAKKKGDEDGKDGDKKAQPADQKKDDGEMSTEAVAMAYLLRGVHF